MDYIGRESDIFHKGVVMICTRNKNEFMEMLQGNEKYFYRTHIFSVKVRP